MVEVQEQAYGKQQIRTKDYSVTLYLNGVAHVVASVELDTQHGAVQVTGISPKFDLETLHTTFYSKKVRVLEARVLESTKIGDIAKEQIGQKVYDRRTDEEVEVLGIDHNQLLVTGSKGVYSKPVDAFTYNTEAIRARGALELNLEGSSENDKLDLSYLTKGLKLIPHYNIVLTPDNLVLNSEVVVHNETGKPYEDVELEVVPGEVGVPYLPRGRERPTSVIRRLVAGFEGYALTTDVTVFEEEGQIGYAFGKRNLPEGPSRFSVFATKGLDYRIIYSADLQGSIPTIRAALRFKTPITLSSGSLAVYREKAKPSDEQILIERYEGGGAIQNTLKDNNVNVPLREPDTLEMRLKQMGETRIVKTNQGTEAAPLFALEKEFEVTAKNVGQDDVIIETYLSLSETERLLGSNLQQHEESSGRRVRWNIPVNAGQEATLTYKTQHIGLRPASQNQLRRR